MTDSTRVLLTQFWLQQFQCHTGKPLGQLWLNKGAQVLSLSTDMYCLLREWEFSLFYFSYEFFKKPNALGLLCPADGQSPHKQSISLYLSLCFSLHLCCLFHSSESSLNGSGPRILAQCTCAIIFVVKTKIRIIFSTSRKWIPIESFILKGVPLI